MIKSIKYLFLVLILLTPSCGPFYRYNQYRKKNPTPVSKYLNHNVLLMDKKISPIFEVWLQESNQYKAKPDWDNVNFIYFSDTLSDCFAGIQVDGEGIYINSDYKENPSLKVIVYHELGHGMFHLPHDTVGINIMGPYFNNLVAQIYLTNWEMYKKQYWLNIKNK